MFPCWYLWLIKTKLIGLFFPWISTTYAIIINIGICMWNPSVVSWLGEKGFASVKHMGQHICFDAMCDFVANSHINVIKGTFTQKHCIHGHDMSYRTYRLCPFITFLVFKSGLAANNYIWLLIVHLIINKFPFYSQTWIS